MNPNTLFTNILGVLIAAGIIGIYTKIDTMNKDIVNVRLELVQYHTIVGSLQKEIEDMALELKEEHDRHNR